MPIFTFQDRQETVRFFDIEAATYQEAYAIWSEEELEPDREETRRMRLETVTLDGELVSLDGSLFVEWEDDGVQYEAFYYPGTKRISCWTRFKPSQHRTCREYPPDDPDYQEYLARFGELVRGEVNEE